MSTPATRTRVLIVDDHAMFSELMASVLGQHDDLTVAVATTGDEALAHFNGEAPDVVLLDYMLPGEDGIVVARRIRREAPDVPIVMLTGMPNDELLRASVLAGCTGFVSKDKAVDDLVDAVRSVRDGHSAIDPDDMARLAAVPRSAHERYDLTPRELEVLRLLADGLTTREISESLFISNNTARNHVQRLITKLGAHSRLGAVATARRAGLVASESELSRR